MTDSVVGSDLDRPAGTLEVDNELAEDVSELVRAGQRGMVLNLVADLHPADLAQLLLHLPFDEAHRVFHWLPVDYAGDVLPELDPSFRTALLEEVLPERITALIDELDTDDAADVLSDLPTDIAQRILPDLEDAEDLERLLTYEEDTAGGIMGTEYVSVRSSWTVAEATEEVRRHADIVEEVYGLYVVDRDQRLQGNVSLTKLLLSPSNTTVGEIMDTDVISVTTDVDQEEVARIMERYDLISLPVVDQRGRLLGLITIDDVVDVIREEAEEDINRMSGVSGDEGPRDTVFQISRGRLPWLLTGLLGAGFSGFVISTFESALEEAVILATFIPIVTAMAGNAGIQSSAIVVQGLASGELWSGDLIRRVLKELGVAIVNGLALAVILIVAVVSLKLGDQTLRLAITAGSSLLTVIVMATLIGTTVPLLLHRLGIDPALATGPFITTSNDILGLMVFFLIATLVYL
jgi:magnesium transporter